MLDNPHSQLRGINRHIDLFKNIRQSADMVFMTVGDDTSYDLINIILNVGHIRNNQVNPQHIICREG